MLEGDRFVKATINQISKGYRGLMKSQLCTSPHVQSTPDDMLLDSKATFSFPNGPLEKSMSCDLAMVRRRRFAISFIWQQAK
jgi:hypothetical protein